MFRGAFTRKVRVVLRHVMSCILGLLFLLLSTVYSYPRRVGGDVGINKIPRIRPKLAAHDGRLSRCYVGREKWAENLIFRIKNIEIQNPSLPRHKLSLAP